MNHLSILWLADSIQLFSVVLSVLGFLPQILKLLKDRDSTGLALRSWLVWTLGSSMGLFYALSHYLIERSCAALAITASVSFCLNLTTLLLIWIYPSGRSVASPPAAVMDASAHVPRLQRPVNAGVEPLPPGITS